MRPWLFIFLVLASNTFSRSQNYDFEKAILLNPGSIKQKLAHLKVAGFVHSTVMYDSSGNTIEQKLRECHFDGGGNLVEDIWYSTPAMNSGEQSFQMKYVYRYDAFGKLVEHTLYENGNEDQAVVVSTDNTGVSEIPSIDKTTTFHRYGSGECVEQDSTAEGIVTRYYYERDYLVSIHRNDKNSNTSDTTEFRYDENGNCIHYRTTSFTCQFDVIAIASKYDAKNRPSEITLKKAAGGVAVYRYVYHRDRTIIKKEHYSNNNQLEMLAVAEYSAEGLKKSETIYHDTLRPSAGELYRYTHHQ